MNISQIKTQSHKTVIDSVSGVLSDIGEPRKREGDYPEVNQGAKITQGQDWMFLDIANHPDLRQYDGQFVTFSSVQGKHGLNGVAVKKVEKNGKTYTNVRVTASAKISVGGQEAPQASQAPQQGVSTPQPTNAPQNAAQSQTGGTQVLGMTVGMAINNAVKLIGEDNCSMDYLKSLGFSKDVHMIASDLIRVSRALEQGKLAPHPKDRGGSEPQPEPAPAQPQVNDEEEPF